MYGYDDRDDTEVFPSVPMGEDTSTYAWGEYGNDQHFHTEDQRVYAGAAPQPEQPAQPAMDLRRGRVNPARGCMITLAIIAAVPIVLSIGLVALYLGLCVVTGGM